MSFNETKIAQGVSVIVVPANRFKTNEIAINLVTPLDEKTVSTNAVLFNMLARSTKNYPNMLSLNRKLDLLYGASVAGTVVKSGNSQILGLTISSLDDRFSLEDNRISSESLELLFSMLLDARVDENGDFYPEDIEREKRIVIDKINSEINEKRVYSLRRLEEIMFDGEPFAINKFGTIEDVNKVTNDDLKNALSNLIKSAKIIVTAVGNANEADIIELTKNAFQNVERCYVAPNHDIYVRRAENVKDVTERIDVKQGKLVLGFRVDVDTECDETQAVRSLADVFGGGPYSKLFANVREKLSLCYYCSARYDRRNSSIIVQCGCEEENMDKAVEEILNQLEIIKSGDFDKELEASRLGMCDSINSVSDDPLYLLTWYTSQVTDSDVIAPATSVERLLAVTKEQIVESASLLSLDTVYRLCSTKEGK